MVIRNKINKIRKALDFIDILFGSPGRITRRFAPRPAGRPKGRSPPLRGVVEPSCLCRRFEWAATGRGARSGQNCNFVKTGSPGRIRNRRKNIENSGVFGSCFTRIPPKTPLPIGGSGRTLSDGFDVHPLTSLAAACFAPECLHDRLHSDA